MIYQYKQDIIGGIIRTGNLLALIAEDRGLDYR